MDFPPLSPWGTVEMRKGGGKREESTHTHTFPFYSNSNNNRKLRAITTTAASTV